MAPEFAPAAFWLMAPNTPPPRTREHNRADVNDGLSEVPGKDAVVHDVLEGRDRGDIVVEGLVHLATKASGVVSTENLGSNAVNVVRLTARNTAAFLEVGLSLGQTSREALALRPEGGRENTVRAVGESRGSRERVGGVEGNLAETEEIGGLLGGDAGDRARTGRNEGVHGKLLASD